MIKNIDKNLEAWSLKHLMVRNLKLPTKIRDKAILSECLKFDLWPRLWSFLENILYVFKKSVYSAVGWSVLKCQLDSVVHVQLHIHADFLSICSIYYWEKSGELSNHKFLICRSLTSSVGFCFMYFEALLLGTCTFRLLCLLGE